MMMNNNPDKTSNNTTKKGGSDGVKYDRLALTDNNVVDDGMSHHHQQQQQIMDQEAAVPDGLFCDDDENNDDENEQDETHVGTTTTTTTDYARSSWYTTCLLADDRFAIGGVPFVDGPVAVKLLKFLTLTLSGIVVLYKWIRLVNWEHKAAFTLTKFWTFQSTAVLNDAVTFFVVARLWHQRGVDHLAFVAVAVASNVFMSVLPQFSFLQASLTLYNMHCTWSWKLWTFVGVLAPLVVMLVFWHVRYAVRRGIFVRKFLELVVATVLWMVPNMASPYFHLHHWFAGWWLGMHCNYHDVWWSRAAMAWCWGMYMNGIAAYGRDPVLTCGYALFVAEQNKCPFLDCYVDGLAAAAAAANANHNETDNSTPLVQPMVRPDWRNCSADAYHP